MVLINSKNMLSSVILYIVVEISLDIHLHNKLAQQVLPS